MPIIGVIDSSKSGNLYQASFDSIATTTVGAGGTSSITFSSIPAGYTHLQLRCLALGGTGSSPFIRFNGDSGTNYSWHSLFGIPTNIVSSNASTSTTGIVAAGFQDGLSTTYPAMAIIDILDYANTNKFKTIKNSSGQDWNNPGSIAFISGSWRNTTAISSITFYRPDSSTFSQYSSFALYGIKVA